jgi:SAM-dependent methyltransferase
MNIVGSIHRKISKSLSTRGFLGTLVFLALYPLRQLGSATGRNRRERALNSAMEQEFDRKHGVDTAGYIPLSRLELSDKNWMLGTAYQGIGPNADFEELFRGLELTYPDFTFVDLGSGKGRALMLASLLPFRKIVGVEFSRELVDRSEENLRRWRRDRPQCPEVEVICGDAAQYTFPEDPLVLYMYNPFGRPVMAQVAENLAQSFAAHPRRIAVAYFTPKYVDLWARLPFLTVVATRPGCHVYDTRPTALAA